MAARAAVSNGTSLLFGAQSDCRTKEAILRTECSQNVDFDGEHEPQESNLKRRTNQGSVFCCGLRISRVDAHSIPQSAHVLRAAASPALTTQLQSGLESIKMLSCRPHLLETCECSSKKAANASYSTLWLTPLSQLSSRSHATTPEIESAGFSKRTRSLSLYSVHTRIALARSPDNIQRRGHSADFASSPVLINVHNGGNGDQPVSGEVRGQVASGTTEKSESQAWSSQPSSESLSPSVTPRAKLCTRVSRHVSLPTPQMKSIWLSAHLNASHLAPASRWHSAETSKLFSEWVRPHPCQSQGSYSRPMRKRNCTTSKLPSRRCRRQDLLISSERASLSDLAESDAYKSSSVSATILANATHRRVSYKYGQGQSPSRSHQLKSKQSDTAALALQLPSISPSRDITETNEMGKCHSHVPFRKLASVRYRAALTRYKGSVPCESIVRSLGELILMRDFALSVQSQRNNAAQRRGSAAVRKSSVSEGSPVLILSRHKRSKMYSLLDLKRIDGSSSCLAKLQALGIGSASFWAAIPSDRLKDKTVVCYFRYHSTPLILIFLQDNDTMIFIELLAFLLKKYRKSDYTTRQYSYFQDKML